MHSTRLVLWVLQWLYVNSTNEKGGKKEGKRREKGEKNYWHFFAEYDLVFNFIKI